MAVFPTLPFDTTLSAAITASQTSIKTAASTGFTVGYQLVIGKEVLELTKVNTTTGVHEVKRGMRGTQAAKHASASIVYMAAPAIFGPNTKNGVEVAGYDGALGTPTLPLLTRWVDPDTGYEYVLCAGAAAHAAGDWVSISAAGVSTALAVASRGRVGIVTEATAAADDMHWVAVVGTFYGQSISATTGTTVVTNVKGVAVGTTCELGGFVVYGVASLAAAATTGILTTGLLYGSFTISNPFVSGVKHITNAAGV